MKIKHLYIILLIGPIYLTTVTSYAQQEPSLTSSMIADDIASYLYEELSPKYLGRLEIQVKAFDHRIKLKSCLENVRYSIPSYNTNSQRIIVKVQCTDPYWNLHVPATLSVFREVVTTTKSLSRSEVISKSDVNLQEMNIINLQHGYLENLDEVVGKIAAQPLRQGQILNPNALTLPYIIKKGELVKITANGNGISVLMQGAALENGALGYNIKVKNFTSNKTIEGLVIAAGTVKVPF
jgi:flagellar basal body P-ring formation protein FlgA